MSDTKRTKGSASRRSADKGDVAVAEKAIDAQPAVTDIDDILGDLGVPVGTHDSLDDILGEIAPAGPVQESDELDDILGELSPAAAADPFDDLDDLLGELAPDAPADPFDDLDDLLGELAPSEGADDLDAFLDEVSGPAPAAKSKKKRGKADAEPVEPEDDAAGDAPASDPANEPESAEDAGEAEAGPSKIALVMGKFGGLARATFAAAAKPLRGKHEISRKAHVGLIAAVVVLGSVVVGETTYIIARPSGSSHHAAPEPAPAVTVVPVDYSKVDLTLYRDKVRALHEGGRDLMRNAAIKQSILDLDNGEILYDELRELARGSAAADRADVRNDRVTIRSCDDDMICGEKAFTLVYNLRSKDAEVCMTERYADGNTLSYSYGPEGYHEQASCAAH